MPIFHDGNGPIKNTKTVDARALHLVTGEPLAGVPLMGGVPMLTPATRTATMRFSSARCVQLLSGRLRGLLAVLEVIQLWMMLATSFCE